MQDYAATSHSFCLILTVIYGVTDIEDVFKGKAALVR